MAKRTIRNVHSAQYEPIADLVTWRALPTGKLPMNRLDPFIFLNHHGWQEYPRNNQGLPFGPHPHRGFETVTFILEGDLMHQDSSGASSVIGAGGVQWMTAGSGLIHAEISSEAFKKTGGPLEILQLWVNLPAAHKMTPPRYKGLQGDEIPEVESEGARIHPVSGVWNGQQGPFESLTDVALCWIDLTAGTKLDYTVPEGKTIFFYVVKGRLTVNGQAVAQHQLAEFDPEGTEVAISADEGSLLLFGHATPFNEPFVAYGPFVMNTKEEIMHAYADYEQGKFGAM